MVSGEGSMAENQWQQSYRLLNPSLKCLIEIIVMDESPSRSWRTIPQEIARNFG